MMFRGSWLIYAMVAICCSCQNGTPKKELFQADKRLSPLEAYCHGIDYGDTVALCDNKVMTKRMVQFVKLLPGADSLAVKAALSHFLNGIKHVDKALLAADSLADLYLNNPASPVRNEGLYLEYLETLVATDGIPDFVRERGAVRLRTASLNRPGTVATDFRFLTRKGKRLSLHELKSECTLLVFYDPECPHCADILDEIAGDARVNASIAECAVTVLAVYAEGKKDVWERTKCDLPSNWLVGYDVSGILEHNLYDLPAMPIVYLLDRDKRVLLKDPNVKLLLKGGGDVRPLLH